MFDLLKRAFKWASEWYGNFVFLHDWFFPLAAPLVAGAVGYLQHEEWMWIIVAMTVVFACMSVGLAVTDMHLERRSPLNKLQSIVTFGCDLNSAQVPAQLAFPGNRSQRRTQKSQFSARQLSPTQLDPSVNRTIENAQLGIQLLNTASYPISCFLFSAKTDIEGNEPPRSEFPKGPFLVPPGIALRLMDDRIDMDQRPCGRMIGSVNIVVKYGKQGKEIFELHTECKVSIVMEHYGLVSQLSMDFTKPVT